MVVCRAECSRRTQTHSDSRSQCLWSNARTPSPSLPYCSCQPRGSVSVTKPREGSGPVIFCKISDWVIKHK